MDMNPERLILLVSKDVERLTSAMTENTVLFRENQNALTQLISEMREHKAIDDRIHFEFTKMQDQIYGTASEIGLVTKVHDINGKMSNIWKLVWTAMGTAVTAGLGLLFSRFN